MLPYQVAECANSQSTHILLFPAEEKGFGASAYKVDWNPEDAPSSKYLYYLTKSKMC